MYSRLTKWKKQNKNRIDENIKKQVLSVFEGKVLSFEFQTYTTK